MMNLLTTILLPILLPLVTGYLTTGGMQFLKKISDTVNRLPVWIKPIAVMVLSTAITIGAKSLGVQLSSSDLGSLGSTDIQAVLGGLVAIMLHNSKKSAEVQNVLAIPPTYVDGKNTSGAGILNPPPTTKP